MGYGTWVDAGDRWEKEGFVGGPLTRKEANAHMRHKYGADWYENEGAMKERDELRRGSKSDKVQYALNTILERERKKPAARMKGKQLQKASRERGREFKVLRSATKTSRHRPIKEIAHEIGRDWFKNKRGMHFSAVPTFEAMLVLDDIDDMYGSDTGGEVVASFLANAQSWRGPTARKLKAELNQILRQQS